MLRAAEGVAAVPPPSRPVPFDGAMWGWLLPLMSLLRPYPGLYQDGRIYIGRGIADLDPGGVGRDIMFADDAQTGFSIMRVVIRALLAVLSPGHASMVLALAGSLLWLAGAVALARGLARGRVAWAAVVCMMALPAAYGAFGSFAYAEALATPRIFAEAAVLGALAAVVTERLTLGLGLLAIAAALHPLMALPGLAVAAVMLVRHDRRWIVPIAAALAALAAAVALGLPLAGRLLVPLDPEWASILRQHSTYLFPSLWPIEALGPIACQLSAVAIAGSLAPPRVRALLWSVAGVAVAGVATSLAFGDWQPSVLIAQLQPWRALWLLAVIGNAGLALAAVPLWTGRPSGRLTLSLLALTWLSSAAPELSALLAAITVAVHVAGLRGALSGVTPRLVLAVGAAAALMGLIDVYKAVVVLIAFVSSAWSASAQVPWFFVLQAGVQTFPLAAAAIGLALWKPRTRSALARSASAAGLAAALLASILLWDGRTSERRMAEGGDTAPFTQVLPATGDVLWVEGDVQSWTLARHPAFANPLQGGPTVFSRPLAIEWSDRVRGLVALGLARPRDLVPWTSPEAREDTLPLSPETVEAFCRDRRHPAGLVAPGEQMRAAPPDWQAGLWRPPSPIHRFSAEQGHYYWRTIDAFTVIACPEHQAGGAGGSGQRP